MTEEEKAEETASEITEAPETATQSDAAEQTEAPAASAEAAASEKVSFFRSKRNVLLFGVIALLLLAVIALAFLLGMHYQHRQTPPAATVVKIETVTAETSQTTAVTAGTTKKTAAKTTAKTTATTTFTLPAKGSYTDPDSQRLTKGTLTETYAYDIDQDGKTEQIGKYRDDTEYGQDYFYQIYRGEKMTFSSYIDGGRGCGTAFDTLCHNKKDDTYFLLRIYFGPSMSIWTFDTTHYPDYVALDTNAASYPKEGNNEGSTYLLNGKESDYASVSAYLNGLEIVDKDERNLQDALQCIEVVPEASSSGDDMDDWNWEDSQDDSSGDAQDGSSGETAADIRNRYYADIEVLQDMIDGYRSDPRYNPAMAGQSQYYNNILSQLRKKQSLAERSGDAATVAKLQPQIDEYETYAEEAAYTDAVNEEIQGLQEQIEKEKDEMQYELSLLQ